MPSNKNVIVKINTVETALKYIGNGFYLDVPARDLTKEEVAALDPELVKKMIADGNYEMVTEAENV